MIFHLFSIDLISTNTFKNIFFVSNHYYSVPNLKLFIINKNIDIFSNLYKIKNQININIL